MAPKTGEGNSYAFCCMLAVLAAFLGQSQACQSAKSTTARLQPSLDFIPKFKTTGETTLIWLKSRSKANYLDWNNNILESLEVYYYSRSVSKASYLKICTYTDGPNGEEVCEVDNRDWEDCNRDSYFNYDRNSPCIFLKLDKMYGWTPEMYDDTLPAEMPKFLKEHIGNISEPEKKKNIWISCDGETAADKENLGPVVYYPKVPGFPGFYFPYRNTEGYLSPLVAIRLMRPANGIPISIECRAWAKNIKYDKAAGLGYVQIELLID